MEEESLGIAARLDRRIGRASRTKSLSIRFTEAEEAALRKLAAAQGKTVREWARGALLQNLAPVQMDRAIFTELMGLRLFTNSVLRAIALGQPMTEKLFEAHLDEAKRTKHQTADNVLGQYQPKPEGAA